MKPDEPDRLPKDVSIDTLEGGFSERLRRRLEAQVHAGELNYWNGHPVGDAWLKENHPDLWAAGVRPFRIV